MSKIKENYSAEVIILIIVLVMILTSCKTKEKPIKCCDKESAHALWNCGEDIKYKHSELITN